VSQNGDNDVRFLADLLSMFAIAGSITMTLFFLIGWIKTRDIGHYFQPSVIQVTSFLVVDASITTALMLIRKK